MEEVFVCEPPEVREQGNTFGVVTSTRRFRELSNFKIDLSYRVAGESHPGFVCSITNDDGTDIGEAYFSDENTKNAKTWIKALNCMKNEHGLMSKASDKQITSYVMMKKKQLSKKSVKYAAKVTGLNTTEGGRKLWVLNAAVQIDEEGNLVGAEESPVVWLGQFFPKDSCPTNIPACFSNAMTDLDKSVLPKLINALESYYGSNFPASLLILGAYLLCIHYEALMDFTQQVPATIAFGKVSLGKSRACKAALATMGLESANFVCKISDPQCWRRTSTTTLGLVIDDLTNATKEISEKILMHFERSPAENFRATYTPRTTFITSVNHESLHSIIDNDKEQRLVSRVVLVPFCDEDEMSPSSRVIEDRNLQECLKEAYKSAGSMIAVGKLLCSPEQRLCKNVVRITDMVPEASTRIKKSYAMLMLATQTLLEESKMTEHEDCLWEFFESHVVPAIKKYQIEYHAPNKPVPSAIKKHQLEYHAPSNKPVPSDAKDFEEMLIKAVKEQPVYKVLTFLVSDCKVTSKEDYSKTPSVALYPKQFFNHTREIGIPMTRSLLDNIARIYPEKSSRKQQHFLKPGVKLNTLPPRQAKDQVVYVRAIKIARTALRDETLEAIENACSRTDTSSSSPVPPSKRIRVDHSAHRRENSDENTADDENTAEDENTDS